MPVRSLNSSVFKWPDAEDVDQAVRRWALERGQERSDVRRIGYFGSYANGNWGVGSDLDLIIILIDTDRPFERRSIEWDTLDLPVPSDVLVYSQEEWDSLKGQNTRFYRTLNREVVWVYQR